MSKECKQIHEWARGLQKYTFQELKDKDKKIKIPPNGIYIIFEEDGNGHDGRRITRIGTHTKNGNLKKRLMQHISGSKETSIFRKNIGLAYLADKCREEDIKLWKMSEKKAKQDGPETKKKYDRLVNEIEAEVTNHLLQKTFTFAVFEVENEEDRLECEAKLIGTISACDECEASGEWLGCQSPKPEIKNGKLWLTIGLSRKFSEDELENLIKRGKLEQEA